MSATSRFLPAAGGGLVGAALCVGALAVGGVFDDDAVTQVVTARPAAATSSVAASPAASGSLAALYARTSPSVVEIQARGVQEEGNSSPFPDPRNGQGVATGTGFVVDADGTIVTNAHVVSSSKDVTVRFDEDDDRVKATVLGTDPSSDVAVLKIDPKAAGQTLRPLELARADDVKVGDTALAIGNPFGLDRTATAGIISATDRDIDAPNGFAISGALQTDAPINPGNSGGPLLDARGRVLGINSQILTGAQGSASSSSGNVGIGFAVPASTVARVLPDLEAGRTIARPYLGVSTAERASGDGAVIGQVVKGGPGERGKLRARDIIVSVDGKAVARPDDVAAAIEGRTPGAKVPVTVLRDGKRVELTVTLGTRPATVR